MSTRQRYGEYQAKVRSLLRNQNTEETVEFILSGQYATLSRVMVRTLRSWDLFVAIARGYNPGDSGRFDTRYRLAAFDAFVENKLVFRAPYRMAFMIKYINPNNPFTTIIAAQIPPNTWTQMPAEILNDEAVLNRDDELVRRQIQFCLYFGRTWFSMSDVIALEGLYQRLTTAESEVIDFADEVGATDERGLAYTDEERDLLSARLRRAAKRVCYNAVLAFAIGTVGLRLPVYVFVELAHFAVPCYGRNVITQYDAVRILERVREAYIRTGERLADASAIAIREAYDRR